MFQTASLPLATSIMPTATIYYTTYPTQPPSSATSPCSMESSPTSVVPMVPSVDGTKLEPMLLGEQRPFKLQKKEETGWTIPVSATASKTNHSARDLVQPIVDEIKLGMHRLDGKNPISLATADPTMPHLPPCTKAMEAVVQAALYKPHAAGYTHASGTPEARRAIALHHSCPEHQLSPDHIIVTNGCSGALDLALTSLLDPGTSILIPHPGFPLYEEIATSHGANAIHYKLDATKRWECDFDHLEDIMASNENVRAIVINNPSTHGSVFSEKHLQEILDFCLKHKLPIVSDEIYGDLTFGAHKFHPMAQIAAQHGRKVPVIVASGLSKQFMLPGWRIGWLAFQDNVYGSLRQVEQGAHRLAQTIHGVSCLTQAAIPTLLSASTPDLREWKENHRSALERQGMLLCSGLNDCYCLKVGPPQGSMYAIVQLHCQLLDDDIQNDMDFALKLVQEENIFVLPGSAFGAPGTFRVAFSASEKALEVASKRIADFCRRHNKHWSSSLVTGV